MSTSLQSTPLSTEAHDGTSLETTEALPLVNNDKDLKVSATHSTRKRFRPELQGLRGLDALFIAGGHIFTSAATGGVGMFFTLSGILVLSAMHANATQSLDSATPFKFLLRSLSRICPEVRLCTQFCSNPCAVVHFPPCRDLAGARRGEPDRGGDSAIRACLPRAHPRRCCLLSGLCPQLAILRAVHQL